MAVSTEPLVWLGIASALLLAGTGVGVGYVGRFRGFNLAFMLLWTGWGVTIGIDNMFSVLFLNPGPFRSAPYVGLLLLPAIASMLVGALWIIGRFPDGRPASWTTWVLTAALVAGMVGAELERYQWASSLDVVMLGNDLVSALMMSAAAGLALRFPDVASASPVTASQTALVAAALVIYPGFFFAYNGFGAPQWLAAVGVSDFPVSAWASAWAVIASVLVSVLWFRASILMGHDPRARRVAIWVLVPALAGLIQSATYPTASLAGLTRLTMLLVFAYAIVRHQLHGINLKVRWTVSKSTLAATYVAVFFVATEAAQQFLGDRTNSAYAGIVVVGLLLLAVGPIQRFAERFATRAVPDESRDPRGIYLDLARRLLADGNLSNEDRRRLAHLADQLGLRAGDAHDLLANAQSSAPA